MVKRSIGLLTGTMLMAALVAAPHAQPPSPEASAGQGGQRAAAPGAPAATVPAADPRVQKIKDAVSADIQSPAMYDLGQVMTDTVFSFGELGFQEFETTKYLTRMLRDNGFTVEEGVAGIPTAWVARWGSGHPVIALGSDVDCIPQASQKPGVAYHDPIIEGAPGHGEGHNSGTPLNIVAAIAAKRAMEREKLPGTIMIWPGIAEELVGTKAYYVRAGMFKDVDVVLYNHVGSNLSTSWGDSSGNGLISVEYMFEGETAHSASAPWRGRSAEDAAELMSVGWQYRREHLRLQQRSHSVITNGGDQPNVVPRTASIWFYFRETNYEQIKNLWDIGDKMAEGASLMTNTSWKSRVLGSAWPAHMNRTLAETLYANIKAVGLPKWSEADEALAKGTQREMKVAEVGMAKEIPELRGRERDSGRRQAGRRVRRHRRHLVERAHRVAQLPVELPGGPRPQLGQRHLDGDADRAQGRERRRARAGDDGDRPRDAAGAREGGARLLRQRAAQAAQVHAAHPPAGPAGHVAQQGHHGQVPRGDEEVLLRLHEVQDLHGPDEGAARLQLSDGAIGENPWAGRA